MNSTALKTQPPAGRSNPLQAVSRRRVAWADSAKGLSILGVGFMHIVTGAPHGEQTTWATVSSILDPLRMPLFFLVSGLFAHRVITRNLEDLWFRRLWFLLIPYLIYTPIQAGMRLYIMDALNITNLIQAIFLGDPGLWFLYTLMVYNIAAVLLRRQPPYLAFLMSLLPALVASMSGMMMYQSVYQALLYAPVFFLGLHYREFFFGLSRRAFHLPTVAGVLALFVVWELVYRGAETYYFEGWDETVSGQQSVLGLVRTMTAVPMGVILAVWISRTPVISRVFNFVGRNTLPIYVSHHAVLMTFDLFLYPYLWGEYPELRGFIDDANTRILCGIVIFILTSAIFYGVSKTPILKWTLYPPPLTRRRTTPAEAPV